MPLLVASDEGHLVNTSSVNGFWASLGPGMPHTAYSAAKFAVKGFSEALLEDFRLNAPHVGVSVVMPGHIGTDIVNNSRSIHGGAEGPDDRRGPSTSGAQRWPSAGMPVDAMDDDADPLDDGDASATCSATPRPMSAAEAATIILDGVQAGTLADPRRRRRPPARRGRAGRPPAAYGEDGLSLGSASPGD